MKFSPFPQNACNTLLWHVHTCDNLKLTIAEWNSGPQTLFHSKHYTSTSIVNEFDAIYPWDNAARKLRLPELIFFILSKF